MELTEEQIDRFGSILEHSGFSDEDIDAYFLEHFGTKGMRWGVRKGRRTTGMSRTRGAAIDRNNRRAQVLRRAMEGTGSRRQMAVARAFVGEERVQERLSTALGELTSQNARIRSGRVTLEDRLVMGGSVSIAGLLVSRTPGDDAN